MSLRCLRRAGHEVRRGEPARPVLLDDGVLVVAVAAHLGLAGGGAGGGAVAVGPSLGLGSRLAGVEAGRAEDEAGGGGRVGAGGGARAGGGGVAGGEGGRGGHPLQEAGGLALPARRLGLLDRGRRGGGGGGGGGGLVRLELLLVVVPLDDDRALLLGPGLVISGVGHGLGHLEVDTS